VASPPLRIGLALGQLDLGGSEGQALALAAGLARRGHDARLFCFLGGARQPQAETLSIPCSVPRWPWAGAGSLGFVIWLRRFRPQVVYTFTFRANLWGRLLARLCRVPVIVAGYRQQRTYWYDPFTLSWAQAVVCNCQAVADLVDGRYRLPRGRLHVIPNGVDLDRFRGSKATEGVRAELGLERRHDLIVLNARMHPNKDHETALRALELVRRERPDVRLVLLGEGPRRLELQHIARTMGLEAHLRFPDPRLDVAPVLAAAGIGWLSSRIEGSPNAVLEYMASGLPVVATRAGGTSELVRHGVEGFLVELGDHEALARHTVEILSKPELATALGRAGRERAAESFGLGVMVSRTERLLQGLVAAE